MFVRRLMERIGEKQLGWRIGGVLVMRSVVWVGEK